MKIAVNTRLLMKGNLDGIGWFEFEQFSRICRNHPEHEFHFLFDRPFSQDFVFSDNIVPHVIPPPARHPILFRIWYDITVPIMLRRIKADIFISPDAMISLRTSIPQIVVLHDLNFEHYPEDLPVIISRYLRKRTPLFVAKAKRIVTVSEFSKKDIVICYGVLPEKIDVVYNGVNEDYSVVEHDERVSTRKRLTNGAPYFIFVSSIHPRKNLARLFQAFDLFKSHTGSDAKLVVVGKRFWLNKDLDAVYNGMVHRDDVVFIGRIEVVELRKVVGSALASVYVSYYEGFGLPIVEAFRCGVPVIASNMTAMPEVAGDAALLVDPFNIEGISDALNRIWADEDLRENLVQKGFERVKRFSWDASAQRLWECIEKVL